MRDRADGEEVLGPRSADQGLVRIRSSWDVTLEGLLEPLKARGAGKVGWEGGLEMDSGQVEGKTPGLRDGLGSGCGEKGLREDTCSFDSSI